MNEHRIDRWYDERVEPFLDGALPDREARLFAARLAHDPALAEVVGAARAVSEALATVPRYRCPSDLSRRVGRITATRPRPIARPARRHRVAAACAAALALGIWVGVLSGPDGPTAAELAAARQELSLALSYLDKAGDLATREVGEQVVGEGIAGSVEKGMRHGRESAS